MLQTSSHNNLPRYLLAAEELRGNSGQWRAYESTGNCVILAGPGSGKTKTLTIKMAKLLAEEIKPPRGIACITYSTECVRELKSRLDTLGVQEDKHIFIGTVHSFCYKNVILPYGQLAGLPISDTVKVASKQQRDMAFKAALDKSGAYGDPANLKSRMDNYRNTYIDRDANWLKHDEITAELVLAYEEQLRNANLIDFDDMVVWGVQLIEKHKWIRDLIHARFPVLVVDEYQDLGYPLHRMVLSLCVKAGIRLIAVGDPDQSIYGFRGAQPELLRDLSKMDGIETIRLRLNYRCGKKIIQASQITLGEDRKYVAPPKAHEGVIEFHKVDGGLRKQAEKICLEIIPDVLRRHPELSLGDIAILYVDKNDGDVIAEVVQANKMEYIRNDQNAPYPKTPITRWLEDCAAWCSKGWRTGKPRLSQLVNTWLSFNRSISDEPGRMQLKKAIVDFLWSHRNSDMLLRDWLKSFTAVGMEVLLSKEPELIDEREAWTKLYNCCQQGKDLSNFTLLSFAGQGGSPHHLNLYTIHSSKGLEFGIVILMGLEQGRLPWNNIPEPRRMESKRLFYVGLTRGKYEVHITYSGWYMQGGRVHKHGPSEFVLELQKYFEDYLAP